MKKKNLESLIASTLKCAATADFNDLKAAIQQISSESEVIDQVPVPQCMSESSPLTSDKSNQDDCGVQSPVPETLNSGIDVCATENEPTSRKPSDFVVGLFMDDNVFYVGEVMSVEDDHLRINFMTCLKNGRPDFDKFWLLPSEPDCHTILNF